jgi:flagellar hook-length control protein FliK
VHAEPRHETPQVRELPLPRAPHAVGQLIHLAQVKGVSHARLNLRPAELGGIEIRLTTDASGLTAKVVADSPEAAALLQSAADDLRRQLERNGVTVASLDISTGTTSAGSGDARPGGEGGHATRHDGAPADDEPAPAEQTLTLPDGVLVDVLA